MKMLWGKMQIQENHSAISVVFKWDGRWTT